MTKLKKIIILASMLIFVIAAIIFFPNGISNKIANGIFIDGIDVSGLTMQQAESILDDYEAQLLSETVITIAFDDLTQETNLTQYGFQLDYSTAIKKALSIGKKGNLFARMKERSEVNKESLWLESKVLLDESLIGKIISDYETLLNYEPIEHSIEFDPTDFDFFAEDADSSTMFDITEGMSGRAIDTQEFRALIYAIVGKNRIFTIDIPFNEIETKYTLNELNECTTFIYHSSSYLNSVRRQILNRNHNIAKALEEFNGLIVMPGETISFFDIIGEPSHENGWLLPNATTADTKYMRTYHGLPQAATTLYNAAFMARMEIVEVHSHSYPAYYNDFGYGMDAYVEYGEKDLVFKNISDYPIFFNTYFWPDSNGLPGYFDVDVYTMPQKDTDGSILHIMPVPEETRRESPLDMEYIQVDEATAASKYPQAYYWTFDEELQMMVYVMTKPRDLIEYTVYRVWYKDCETTDVKGHWTGGSEVKREYSHTHIYPTVQGVTIVKPALELEKDN